VKFEYERGSILQVGVKYSVRDIVCDVTSYCLEAAIWTK